MRIFKLNTVYFIINCRKEDGEKMTQSELDKLIKNDYYHIPRKNPNEAEIRLFLREVGYHCPLCGKELQSRKQSKPGHKQFQIAHIYPNSPTIQQYIVLHELERLGKNSEDFENKIALCHLCHSRQDYHTTKEDYEVLLSIKKKYLEQNALHDAVDEMYLERELKFIVEQICKIPFSELAILNMNPVRVADKFEDGDALILSKITGYVTQYYTFIRDLFRERDGKNGFVFNSLCFEVKSAYIKMDFLSKDKATIFNQMSEWINRKTMSTNQIACEAIAAFFVQNCEVFNEIPR